QGAAPATQHEFWADAIQAVKKSQPDFLFLGEVYWDLEARLQSIGFDYTYDKRLYDYLVYRNATEVQRHLLGVTPEFVGASAHFWANHDARRIASTLPRADQPAAAWRSLGLPGPGLPPGGHFTGGAATT